MKKIEAVIPEEKLDAVFNALTGIVGGFTYFNVKGRGARPRDMVSSGRGGRVEATHNVNAFIYVVVDDNKVDQVVDTITSHASTGLAGEGKIFIFNVEEAIDIGTKKRGSSTL